MSLPTLEATPVPEVTLPEIQKDESGPVPVTPVTAPSHDAHDEPVATRRELWSYYRVYHYIFLSFFCFFCNIINRFSSVFHFGNNVRFPGPARYPEHEIPVLMLDPCVQYAGTWTRG